MSALGAELRGRLISFLSRKWVLVVLFEALGTVALYCDRVDGGQWLILTTTLAGIGVAGNSLEKFTRGKDGQ